ncbi:MAG: GNAT family N-acetyltransferase [Hydrogenoanaerobacterium sp.]
MLKLCGSLAESESVYNARIYTSLAAYGALPNPPLLYENERGERALLCGGVLTLDGTGFDKCELREFVKLCGCKKLICAAETAEGLANAEDTVFCTVMRFAGAVQPQCDDSVCRQPRLDDIYGLLCLAFDNMQSIGFEDWYSDISLKIRRGLACSYAIYEDGVLCASAGVNYQNSKTIVIGSVATAKLCRGRGLATRLVNTLIAREAQGRAVQIVCKNAVAMRLYIKLGFVPIGVYAEINYI